MSFYLLFSFVLFPFFPSSGTREQRAERPAQIVSIKKVREKALKGSNPHFPFVRVALGGRFVLEQVNPFIPLQPSSVSWLTWSPASPFSLSCSIFFPYSLTLSTYSLRVCVGLQHKLH